MKSFLKSVKRQDGFTLVELMVVVAIIGLLSAVAIPNFRKYQAKSKSSEAKLQLSSLYTAMQSWYSDYDNYANCLNLMGFDPSPEAAQRYYAVGFPTGAAAAGNTPSVNNGAPAACGGAATGVTSGTLAASTANVSAFGAGKLVQGAAAMGPANVVVANITGLATPAAQNFVAGAIGVIDANFATATTADAWTIDQNKRIQARRTGY